MSISIHALREESDRHRRGHVDGSHISIHALREESDSEHGIVDRSGMISIHALREESDNRRCASAETRCYFNPRSP